MSETYFDILGVERKYHLAAEDLERRFHERSRLLHPDKHMKADPQTRVKTALATSQLNQAYRALKDPIRRAEHLLEVEGYKISDERSGHKVSPAFLMEIMELREQLADAKAEGNHAAVGALADQVKVRRAEVMSEADDGFSKYEAGDKAELGKVADALIAERYLRRFLDEVEAFEDARADAGEP